MAAFLCTMGKEGAYGSSYLPDLNAVRQTGSIEIVLAGAENLCLGLKTAECATMDNAISINSERTTIALSSPCLGEAALVKFVVHVSIIAPFFLQICTQCPT